MKTKVEKLIAKRWKFGKFSTFINKQNQPKDQSVECGCVTDETGDNIFSKLKGDSLENAHLAAMAPEMFDFLVRAHVWFLRHGDEGHAGECGRIINKAAGDESL